MKKIKQCPLDYQFGKEGNDYVLIPDISNCSLETFVEWLIYIQNQPEYVGKWNVVKSEVGIKLVLEEE